MSSKNEAARRAGSAAQRREAREARAARERADWPFAGATGGWWQDRAWEGPLTRAEAAAETRRRARLAAVRGANARAEALSRIPAGSQLKFS